MFSDAELRYLKTQQLARVATVSMRGVPEVSPVGFEFDGRYFWIGSRRQELFPKTRRYRNVQAGNVKVSLVVDDVTPTKPRGPRGIKVSGMAKLLTHEGLFGRGTYIRITPLVTASWGIESGDVTRPSVKRWH
jgi:pyridoxamine 5'-phosphate oxidase family protein